MKYARLLVFALGISVLINVVLIVSLFAISKREEGMPVEPTAVAVVIPSPTALPSPTAVKPTVTTMPEPSPVSPTAVSPTKEPTPVPTVLPTVEPTVQPTATTTSTPTPEPTATLVPSPTPIVLQGPGWLQYMNTFRLQAGLGPVTENAAWSEGSRLHSTYMSNTGKISHYEDTASPLYTNEGNRAAENGNLAASYAFNSEYDWAFNYWISAPFHALPILDPQLAVVGFGTHRDANAAIELAATLDIKQGLQEEIPANIDFPILFPKDGGEAWVLRYSLPEFPNARVHCGYGDVSGAPIMVQIGPGDQTPNVSSSVLRSETGPIEHCVFDETDYFNPNAALQQAGRSILDQRDAIVLLPRNPLEVGKTYAVELVVNGVQISWSFNAVSPPRLPQP